MKKSIFTLIAVLLLTTILIACGGTPAPSPSPSPTSSPTASPKPSPTASPSPSPTASPKPTTTQKQQWRFYTTGEGTFAYTVSVGMARVANKYNTNVELVILTGKASTQTHALYEQNETDSAYSSAQAALEAWTNSGVFAAQPVKYKPYQSAYLYTADQFYLIPADRTDMKTLADLQGKKLYPHFKGSGAWDTHRIALEALGYWDKITIRDMANTEATDALLTKSIDAIGAFSIGQNTLNPWLTDMDARAKIKILEPSAAEKEKIGKIRGVSVLPPVPAKTLFRQNVGVDNIWQFSSAYGWYFGPNEDAERVYGIIKAWYEHSDELLAISGGFSQFAKIGLEMNVRTIDSMPNVPVHPGVAKYLKEKGVWKDTWKIGELSPRKK